MHPSGTSDYQSALETNNQRIRTSFITEEEEMERVRYITGEEIQEAEVPSLLIDGEARER